MEAAAGKAQERLEAELGELLEQRELRAAGGVSSPRRWSAIESAARGGRARPQAWWAKLATRARLVQRAEQVLDDSNPPFYKWFADGKLNASVQLPRPPRRGRQRRPGRLPLARRGGRGARRSPTPTCSATSSGSPTCSRSAGSEAGDVVGIYLPMIPEVAVAMLACARIGAPHNVVFGGFSPEAVKERMEFSEAKALITVDGARRKGKTAPIKPAVDELLGEVPSIETVIVVRNTGAEVRDDRRPRRLLRRGDRGGRRRSASRRSSTPSTRSTSSTRRARPRSRRGSCTRPAAT